MLPGSSVRHTFHEHQWDGKGQRPPEPEDYVHILSLINAADTLQTGTDQGRQGQSRILVRKRLGPDVFRAVFEILPGKRNRALKLISLAIKT